MRIIYIDIDSLRPDHLGCYHYHRNTSPAIDRVAREGLVCERVYTSDAPCLPSRTALYSGRFGIQTGVVGHGGTASQPKLEITRGFNDSFGADGLPAQLQRLGYHTTMISPFGQRHAAHWIYAGFNEIHNTGQYGMESAEFIQPFVDKWLADNATKDNWYLHINLWDPHTPYRVPASYGDPFAGDPLPDWLDSEELIRRHGKMCGPHAALELSGMSDWEDPSAWPRHPGKITNLAGMRRVIDGYDTGVRYADEHVGRTLDALRAAGVYDDTMVVISADHGENQGELGIYAEHGTADEGTCHVPLIIKFPGGVSGVRDKGLHYQIDLAPTLMDLLGGEKQRIWDGRSYAPTILAGDAAGREELVIGQCAHVCQRSVRWDKWLYMRTYHDGFHLFPVEMLFDLELDPHEQTDLAEKNPEVCREGAWRLSRWHDAQMVKMAEFASDSVDPLWSVMREGGPYHARLLRHPANGDVKALEGYLGKLESTGRKDCAEKLRAKYGLAAAT